MSECDACSYLVREMHFRWLLLAMTEEYCSFFSMQGLPGAQGPVGYPGTRGVKVRHKCGVISGVMSTEIFIPSHISFCAYVYLRRTSCLSL